MITLCFGLPGTGKSTYVKSKPIGQQLRMDLGHNAFRNDEERNKFYKKSMSTTSSILHVVGQKTVFWDTYPEYFDLTTVRALSSNIRVIFAIPKDLGSIIDRVGDRDGRDSFFYHLYAKNGHKWKSDWEKIYASWYNALGKKKVILIDRYDNLK